MPRVGFKSWYRHIGHNVFPAGYFFYGQKLLGWIFSLERQQHGSLTDQVACKLQQSRCGCERPGNHRIKAFGGCIVLHACFDGGGVRKPKLPDDMPYKTDFLAIAVEEPELDLRFRNREWQAWKSRAGPYIEHPPALEQWSHRQAIEDMAGNHIQGVPHGGQVDACIPVRQQSQEPGELLGALRGQVLAERCRTVRYQLNGFFDRLACLSCRDIEAEARP